MKSRAIPFLVIPLIVLLTAAPATLQAQTAPPEQREREPSAQELGETMGQVMEQMGRMMGSMAQSMGGSMQRMMDAVQKEAGLRGKQDEHIEGKLAFLKAELKITPAQEKAWSSFADAMRQAVTKPADEANEGKGSTLPDRLDRQAKTLQARLATLQAKQAAIGGLYGHLSTEQKALADDLIEQIGLV